jgi:hypothetical protein
VGQAGSSVSAANGGEGLGDSSGIESRVDRILLQAAPKFKGQRISSCKPLDPGMVPFPLHQFRVRRDGVAAIQHCLTLHHRAISIRLKGYWRRRHCATEVHRVLGNRLVGFHSDLIKLSSPANSIQFKHNRLVLCILILFERPRLQQVRCSAMTAGKRIDRSCAECLWRLGESDYSAKQE